MGQLVQVELKRHILLCLAGIRESRLERIRRLREDGRAGRNSCHERCQQSRRSSIEWIQETANEDHSQRW